MIDLILLIGCCYVIIKKLKSVIHFEIINDDEKIKTIERNFVVKESEEDIKKTQNIKKIFQKYRI